MEVSGQLQLYIQAKQVWYPINIKPGGPQSWSQCFGQEKNLLTLPGMEPRFLGCPAHSLVTILTKVILVPTKSIFCPSVHSYRYFVLKYANTYLKSQNLHVYDISGSPSSAAEDAVLLGCDALSQRIVVPSASGLSRPRLGRWRQYSPLKVLELFPEQHGITSKMTYLQIQVMILHIFQFSFHKIQQQHWNGVFPFKMSLAFTGYKMLHSEAHAESNVTSFLLFL